VRAADRQTQRTQSRGIVAGLQSQVGEDHAVAAEPAA
jgi:hypothetical protein